MNAISKLASDLTSAFEPLARSVSTVIENVSTAISEAFAPLLARKKPRETGRELAEIAAENQLTVAERHPVRASREHYEDDIDVAYDDGDGFETFVTYSKAKLDDDGGDYE